MNEYQRASPAFEDSREFKLIDKLVQAFDKGSADAFAEAITDYDRITRIDEWLTTILLRIKKSIPTENSGDEDADDLC